MAFHTLVPLFPTGTHGRDAFYNLFARAVLGTVHMQHVESRVSTPQIGPYIEMHKSLLYTPSSCKRHKEVANYA